MVFVLLGCGKLHSDRVVPAGLAAIYCLSFCEEKKDRVIEQQRVAHQAELERQEKKIIELEKEQLEADLRFKSKELSSVVMMNIAHQEF